MNVYMMQDTCVLLLIADGFQADVLREMTRSFCQYGLHVRLLAPIGGQVLGEDGSKLEADYTLANINKLLKSDVKFSVALPDGELALNHLCIDPRVHAFLEELVSLGGQIITGVSGLTLLNKANLWASVEKTGDLPHPNPILLHQPNTPYVELVQAFVSHNNAQAQPA
ncbi:MAG: hypothetical protein AAF629_33070 [Chloroflexota bacterium]